jgi:hypothetical protein
MYLLCTGSRTLLTSRLRSDVVISTILLALVIILWLPRLRGPIDLRWDAGVHYTLGTSLAEGKGYRLLNEPGEIKATQYPPLLPAFIAVHQWVLGTSNPTVVGYGLRLSFFILYIFYIFAIYVIIRHYLPLLPAFGATLICLFNFYTCFMSDACFPEIAFALATILFVLCHNKGGGFFSTMATVFAIMAYALRTVGIALLAACIVEGVLKKEFKRVALQLVLFLIAVISWQSYIYSVESEPAYRHPVYAYQRADYLFYNVSYARNVFLRDPFSASSSRVSFADIVSRSLSNLAQLPVRLGVAITSDRYFWHAQRDAVSLRLGFSVAPTWIVDATLILLGSLILVGIGLQLVRQQWIIPLYLLFYFTSASFVPWSEQFTRYFAPLAPFLAISMLQTLWTLNHCFRGVSSSWGKSITAVFISTAVSLILVEDGLTFVMMYRGMHQNVTYVDRYGERVTYRLFFYKDAYRALDAGLDRLKQQSGPDDVIASSMPHWVYLRTGLKSVMPPFETDPVQTQGLLDSVPVTFLIQDRGLDLDTRRYITPVTHTFPELWELIYSDAIKDASGKILSERFEIYQRVAHGNDASRVLYGEP